MKRLCLLCMVPVLGVHLWAQRKTVTNVPMPTQKASPQELFKRLAPSVVVVEGREVKGDSVTALGSGVVIGPDQVVTNRHVVDAADRWEVKQGERTWSASVTWVDPDHDLALLKADGLQAPTVSSRLSPPVAVGERVYAIGTPEGLEQTLSEGIVSGLRDYEDGYVIQTSAPISPGSSGGGLFDEEGRFVGITTFGLIEGQNLNFALPASWVQALLGVLPSRHRETPAIQQQLSEKSQGAISRGETLLHNVTRFQLMRDLPLSTSHFGWAASQLYSDAEGVECIADEKSADCINNWPLWERASLLMLQLRTEYRTLETGDSEFARSILKVTRSAWSDVSDVYCGDRPGGLYTDLEDKIRACPTLR
jgi:hypothetical protein